MPLVAFLLIGGVWADRLPRQWVMLVSDVVRFACQAVMAWLLLTHRATIWELVVLQFVRGTAEAFFRPAQTGLVPHTVSAGRLQQANALRGLTDSLGVTLGAAMGGVLVAPIGSGWAIGLDSLSYLASAGFCGGCADSRRRPPAPRRLAGGRRKRAHGRPRRLCPAVGDARRRAGSFLRDLRDGWQEFRSRTWLWVMVGEAAVFHLLIIAPLMVLGPYVAKHSLGGAAAWGAILASLRRRPGDRRRGRPAPAAGAAAAAVRLAHLARGAAVCLLRPRLRHDGADLRGGLAASRRRSSTCSGRRRCRSRSRPRRCRACRPSTWMGSLAFYPLGIVIAGPIAAVIGVAGSFALASGGHVRLGRAADRPARHQAGPPPRDPARPPSRRRDAGELALAAEPVAAGPHTGLPVSSHSR